MEERKIIPLKEKISGYDPITQIVVKKDVKTSLQNLKDELKKELCFCHKLGDYSCMNCIEINKAFKKHIGALK